MRTESTLEDRCAIDDEMMRRNRTRYAWRVRTDDVRGFGRRDVLDNDLQTRHAA